MTPTERALAVLDAYMTAFNARDLESFTALIHFPHASVGVTDVTITEGDGRDPGVRRHRSIIALEPLDA